MRDDHTRVWEILKEVETTHPDGSVTVETVKSYIHEKGSGLCYRDATGNFVPSVAEWREVPDGFLIDRCGYGLSIGKTIGSGLRYWVEGHELDLRPAYLMISDGANQAHLAVLNPDAAGSVVPGKPSAVRFPAAFGPGYDLEYVVETGGFHQNLIINEPPQVPGGFDPETAAIYLYTEMNLDEYLAACGLEVEINGEPLDTSPPDLVSPPSLGGCISFHRPALAPGQAPEMVHGFCLSTVSDSSGIPGPPRQTLAAKRLMKAPSSSAAFLVESVPLSYFAPATAAYPITWDYLVVIPSPGHPSNITGTETWESGVTYWVTQDVTVSGTLTIERGAIVKLDPYRAIYAVTNGTIKAGTEGEDWKYVIFTKAADEDYGEEIGGAQQGRYSFALYLVDGSQNTSVIKYCRILNGICPINCLQSLTEPIEHNIIHGVKDYEGDPGMYWGISVRFGAGVSCKNNLVYDSEWYGIEYYQASGDEITNNTVHDSNVGISLNCSTCGSGQEGGITDNLLTDCCVCGISIYNSTVTTLDYNGYWDCTYAVAGGSPGTYAKILEDCPYAGYGQFFLDQYCPLINGGSQTASQAGLDTHTTSAGTNSAGGWTDESDSSVDIGYHYPHLPLKPYVQKLETYTVGEETKSRATIMFLTTSSGTGYVDYGTRPGYGATVSKSHEHALPLPVGTLYVYEFLVPPLELPGVEPNTLCYYRVRHGSDYSHDNTFYTTMTEGDDFRFLAYGDNRGGGAASFQQQHFGVVNAMLTHTWTLERQDDPPRPRFVVHCGDFVNAGGAEEQWRPHFFDPASGLVGSLPLWPSLGNHEYSGDPDVSNYTDLFCVDVADEDYPERWYSFYYGDCHFICLDSNASGAARQAQQGWLEAQLDDTSKTWKFVLLHHPAFSDAAPALPPEQVRTSHDGTANGGHPYEEQPEMYYALHTLGAMFREHGVDVVFCGHNHFYERSGDDTDQTAGIGPTYVLTGGAGAPGSSALHHSPDFDANNNLKREYAEPVFHHVTVEVMSDKLLIKAVRNNGTVLDFDARDTADHFLREARARTMVVQGSTWKYKDDGEPAEGWTEYSFDDSSWESGPAKIGFGSGQQTTIDEAHRNQMTYYFRRKFNTSVNLSTVDFAYVEVVHDDGCVVYLNEVEVFRSNLLSPSEHDTPADNDVSEPYEDNFIRCLIDKSLVQAQNNILAVEVHRVSASEQTDPDMAFDLKLRYFAEAWW